MVLSDSRNRITIRKTDAGTRVGSMDFMGIYVEYVLGVPPLLAMIGVGR